MPLINILIVEDKDTHVDGWKDAISDFNVFAKNNGKNIQFRSDFAKNYREAIECIKSFNFSAAIIDIRLAEDDGTSNENNTSGNDVLLKIVESTMCLAWVYTGQQIDADIPENLNRYIEVIDRAAKSKLEVLQELEIKRDMLDSISEIKSRFSQSKAQHFYSAIWPRWSLWLNSENSIDMDNAIIRHMATHLHASFLNETEKVHPEEYYFTGPMIHQKLDTGDIALVDGKHFILVTPRCEIAQDKNLFYQLVELEDKSQQMKDCLKNLDRVKEDIKTKKLDIQNQKKLLSESDIDNSNKKIRSQRNVIAQAISTNRIAEGQSLAEAGLKTAVENLFQLESAKEKYQAELQEKTINLTKLESDLKSLEKDEQRYINEKKALLPSSGGKISRHILPEIKQLNSNTYGPLHAQFEMITYIDKNDAVGVDNFKTGKYARLSNEFIPSFVERLGSHFSRIGTPDYSHPE